MLTLIQYQPAYGLPNASPFCMKVETWLRMAGVDYRTEILHDPRKTPKGKLPCVVFEGHTLADSSFIISTLNKRLGVDLNQHLSDLERAEARAWQALFEEHLYWILLYSRWLDERFWPTTRQVFFGHLPVFIKPVLPPLIRVSIRKQLFAQGIGRHTQDEIYELGNQDIQAIAAFLGDKAFFLGDQPSELDAVAYAFIANVLIPPMDSPLRATAQSLENLQAYCQRMQARYFSKV